MGGIVGAVGGVIVLVGLFLPWFEIPLFGQATGIQTITERSSESSEFRSIAVAVGGVVAIVAGVLSSALLSTPAEMRRLAAIVCLIAGVVAAGSIGWIYLETAGAQDQLFGSPTQYFQVGFYLSGAGGVIAAIGGLIALAEPRRALS